LCCLLSWHFVPVRNDCSEGNGRSEDKKGENKGDKEFHSEISLFGLWAEQNVTDEDTWETFVLGLCLGGQTDSHHPCHPKHH
jgi:hypothetical protein